MSAPSNSSVTIVADSSPNANSATPTETTITSDGKYGSARSFDGSNDTINIPSSASVNLSSTGGTFSAWINPNFAYDEAVTRYIFDWYLDSDNYMRILKVDTGTLRFVHKGTATWKGYNLDISSNWQQWHHVAMTWNTTSGELKLYFDEELVSTVTGIQALTGSASALKIGNGSFIGEIDEVRLYNYARSDIQVGEDMASGSITGSPPVAHWRMDDGYINGVDNGDLIIDADQTLTLNEGQTLVWNPGKEITISSGASIAINLHSQLKQGYIWVPDSDGDGWITENNQVIADSQPAGYVRRNTITNLTADCDDSSYDVTNTCCSLVTWYQDSDGDLYGNASVTTEACDQPEGYVSDNTDCYDSNANAKPGQTTCYTTNRGDGSFDYDCDSTDTHCTNCSTSCTDGSSFWTLGCCGTFPNNYCCNASWKAQKLCSGTAGCGVAGYNCTDARKSNCATQYPCSLTINKNISCDACTPTCR